MKMERKKSSETASYSKDPPLKSAKSDFLSAVAHGDKPKIEKCLQEGWDINTRTGRSSSLLFLAIKRKDLSLIEFLLQRGAEINGALQTSGILEGYTALHLLSGDNDEKLVRFFLESGADVNFSAADGAQPIHASVYFQTIDIAKILLENGANVNAIYLEELYIKYLAGDKLESDCYKGINLLIHAVIKRNFGLAKVLIQHGADLLDCQKTILLHAIDSNSQEIIQLILESISSLCKTTEGIKLSEFINATYPSGKFSGYTSLHFACKHGNPFSVAHLIENGGNVNASSQNGVQPIHLAVMRPNIEIVKILLDKGANIDALFKTSYYSDSSKVSEWAFNNDITLLTYSIIQGNLEMVKLLLDCDAYHRTYYRFTKKIIFYAAASDNVEIMRLIIDTLINEFLGPQCMLVWKLVNATYSRGDYAGYTPLHMACKNKNLSCVNLLLQNRAEVNVVAADGAQPIQLALMSPKNEKIMKLLLANGANINAIYKMKFLKKYVSNPALLGFNSHFTLLNYAIFVKDIESIEFLVQNGAMVDPRNNLKKTMLMYAVENNLSAAVGLLLNTLDPQDINVRDNSGRTALHYVLDAKHMDNHRFSMKDLTFNYTNKGLIAQLLINAGADRNAMIHGNPRTKIAHSAAFRACLPVLKFVLAKDLSVKEATTSPLTNACVNIRMVEDFDDSYEHLKKKTVRSQIFSVVQECLKNIIRRQAIGHEVSEEDIDLMKEMLEFPSQHALRRLVEEETEAVNSILNPLKTKTVAGSKLTYFEVFSMDVRVLADYMQNSEILAEFTGNRYRHELVYYFDVFQSKWRDAAVRLGFFEEFHQMRIEILMFTCLSFHVMRMIMEFLDSNEDLKNFYWALQQQF